MVAVVVVWVVFIVIVITASRRAGKKPLRHYDKRGSFYMKAQYTVFFTLLGRALLFPEPIHSELTSIIGQCLSVIGLVCYGLSLRIIAQSYNPMVCVREDQALCTRGPYRYVRHPLYSCQMVMMVGSALALQHPIFIALPIVFAVMVLTARREEALLSSLHDDYGDYRRRTRRFIPFIF